MMYFVRFELEFDRAHVVTGTKTTFTGLSRVVPTFAGYACGSVIGSGMRTDHHSSPLESCLLMCGVGMGRTSSNFKSKSPPCRAQ